jgi:hypothetical protein
MVNEIVKKTNEISKMKYSNEIFFIKFKNGNIMIFTSHGQHRIFLFLKTHENCALTELNDAEQNIMLLLYICF